MAADHRSQRLLWLDRPTQRRSAGRGCGRARATLGGRSSGIPRDADPERTLAIKYDIELVRRCLGELPLEYRDVLVLREIEGLSYKEIGSIAEIPIGTVMSRLSRGRTLLLRRLTQQRRKESLRAV
jgi:RNA polymerase sigma factor (sigma-70 family)